MCRTGREKSQEGYKRQPVLRGMVRKEGKGKKRWDDSVLYILGECLKAFVMFYTDRFSKVQMQLPVHLFSHSVWASYEFFATTGQIITRVEQIIHGKKMQQKVKIKAWLKRFRQRRKAWIHAYSQPCWPFSIVKAPWSSIQKTIFPFSYCSVYLGDEDCPSYLLVGGEVRY